MIRILSVPIILKFPMGWGFSFRLFQYLKLEQKVLLLLGREDVSYKRRKIKLIIQILIWKGKQ